MKDAVAETPTGPGRRSAEARGAARLVARIAAGAGAGAVAAVPFMVILWLVVAGSRGLTRLDIGAANALNAWTLDHPGVVTVLHVVELVTSPWSFRLVVLFVAGLLWRTGSRRLATWAIVTMAVGGLLNPVLKEAVQRARPSFTEPVAAASSYSFPSGHAQGSMLGMAVLLLIALPLLRSRGKVIAWAVSGLVVLVTGFDRIGLGVHYLSDVVAGWIAALAVVAGTTIAFDARPGRHVPSRGIDPVAARRLTHERSGQPERRTAADRTDVTALLAQLWSVLRRLLRGAALTWAILVTMGFLLAALDNALWPLTGEEAWVRWLEAHRNPSWNELTAWMSWIADTPRILATMVIVAIVFRLVFHRWRESAFLVTAVTLQALVFALTQAVVSRSRPAVEQLHAAAPTSSFPSGHSGAAFTLYGAIALVLVWHTRRHLLRVLAWAVLLVPPACVAYARLYRGMHFPSDIAGSVLNSALSLAVAARLVMFAALPPQLADILDTSFRRSGAPIGPEPTDPRRDADR